MSRTKRLIELVEIFRAEWPHGFQALDGFSRRDFEREVDKMTCIAGDLVAFLYHIHKKQPLAA